jgi:deazaflavin-dependent oxidoreductase (nitroreductase family)
LSTSPNDFNAQVIEEFRANQGRVGGMFEHMPLVLLHHTGAKSGTERTNPVAYVRDGDRYVVFASKGGSPTHPGWYHNLKAHPETTIEVGTDTLDVFAGEAEREERDRLFNAVAEGSPQFREYAEKAGGRQIPVMVLTPR